MPNLPSGLNVCLDFSELNDLLYESSSHESLKIKEITDLYHYIYVHELNYDGDMKFPNNVRLIEGSDLFDLSLGPSGKGFLLDNSVIGMTDWDISDQICFDLFIEFDKTEKILKQYLDFINNMSTNTTDDHYCNLYY